MKQSIWAACVCLFSALGSLLFGMDMGYIGPILEDGQFKRDVAHVENWADVNAEIDGATSGFIVSVFALGCMASAFPAVSGFFLDKFGRKASLMFGSIVFLAGSITQAASNSVVVMVIGRLVSGCSIGILSTVVPLYQSEIAPSHRRGSCASLHQVLIVLGALIAAFGDEHLLPLQHGWRLSILLPLVPGLIFFVGMLFMPESPRWLVQQGKQEAALSVLKTIRNDGADALAEIKDINDEQEQNRDADVRTFRDLCDARVIRLLFVGVALQVLQQLNGINAFVGFGPRIFNSLGLNATHLQTLLMVVLFVATCPAIYFIERLGRQLLLLIGAIGMFLASFVITVLGVTFTNQNDGTLEVLDDAAGMCIVAAIFMFAAAFAFSWGPVTWVYCAEIFPLKVRAQCVGLTTMSEWAGVFIVNQSTPMLLQALSFGAFGIFSAFCLVAVCFTLWIPETRGVPLERMNEVFDARFGNAVKSNTKISKANAISISERNV